MNKKLIVDTIELIEGTRIGKVIIDGLKKVAVEAVEETEKVATDLAKDKLKETKEKIKESMGGSDGEKSDEANEDSE